MNFLSKFRLPYRDEPAFGFIALVVFLLPLAFSLYAYENFEAIKFAIFLLCVGASGFIFFLRQKKGYLSLKKLKYFYWLLGSFGFWAVLSSFFAQDRLYAFFGFYYRYTSGLIFYAAFLAFIFLLLNLVNEDKLNFLLKIIVFDGLMVALVAFFEGFGWILYQGPSSSSFFHGPSLLGNPDFSAMFLACTLPIALYFLITGTMFKTKIYYGFCIFWTVFASLILASRGGLLAMAACVVVALFLLVIYNFPKKFFLSLLLASLLLGFGSSFFLQVSRPGAVSSILTTADANTSSRLYVWSVSLRGVAEHPLVGFGPGNYALFFEHSDIADPSAQVGLFDDPHNLFLLLAVTGGIPLLLLFLSLVFYPTFLGLKRLYKNKNLLDVALLSSMAAWLASACFNPVPIPMYMLLAILLVALALPFYSDMEIKFFPWQRFLLLALGAFLIYWGAISLVSEQLLGFGSRAYILENYKQSYNLDSLAFAINPTNQLFLNYKTASEIRLGYGRSTILSDINKIEQMHKTQTTGYVTASNLYSLLYSLKNNDADLQAAILAMQSAIKIDHLFSPRYGQLALYYYQAGDLSASRAAIEQDITLNNQDFSAWVLLAKLYQLNNNRPAAILALTKAFEINPSPQLKYFLYLAKTLPNIRDVPLQIIANSPDV